MKALNVKALFISSIIAAVTFIILEYFLELFFTKAFSISETIYYTHFNIYPAGVKFHVINIFIFLLILILIMFTYTLIRPKFNSNISAGIITSLIFLAFLILILSNFTNLGIFTLKMSLISILFNVLELPPAILVGAAFYGEG